MANRNHLSPGTQGRLVGIVLLAGGLLLPSSLQAASSEFQAEPSWQPVELEDVQEQFELYLRTARISAARQAEARNLWWDRVATPGVAGELLQRLMTCVAQADERVAELVEFCRQSERPTTLPDFAWLADSQTPSLVRHNGRLLYARWLVQHHYDDEALVWTEGLAAADVVAPEALLFYRAVASHRVVKADQANAIVAELLQRPDDVPLRYKKLAALMQQDLAGLEDESLDHIARRMVDIRRRLRLGRAGKTVQGVEDGVVASLDKLIEQLEEQAQQQAAAAASQSGGQQSGSPMQDSMPAELKGPGRVEPRDVGSQAEWGNLPEKEREQALQDIGRDFPSHYREVIEEYFRQLATEPTDDRP